MSEELKSTPTDTTDRMQIAAQVLRELLARNRDGAVSTQAVRKEFEARGFADAQELIARLKSNDSSPEGVFGNGLNWRHFGRSFLTEAKYHEAQSAQEAEAAQAEAADDAGAGVTPAEEAAEEEEDAAPPKERKKRRREEARLGAYIVPVLEELYDDPCAPDAYVFDVHSLRGGSDFENVDLLAVHWRSPSASTS